jgi:hypothetical protein
MVYQLEVSYPRLQSILHRHSQEVCHSDTKYDHAVARLNLVCCHGVVVRRGQLVLMRCSVDRPRLQAAGGITIQLVAPDGCAFEAMYFRGEGASANGPTVIRFNGNAEAIELQDEVMPRMYTTAGINFLMFNYRGVGRSRYTKAYFNNDLVSHLIGLARTPTVGSPGPKL